MCWSLFDFADRITLHPGGEFVIGFTVAGTARRSILAFKCKKTYNRSNPQMEADFVRAPGLIGIVHSDYDDMVCRMLCCINTQQSKLSLSPPPPPPPHPPPRVSQLWTKAVQRCNLGWQLLSMKVGGSRLMSIPHVWGQSLADTHGHEFGMLWSCSYFPILLWS